MRIIPGLIMYHSLRRVWPCNCTTLTEHQYFTQHIETLDTCFHQGLVLAYDRRFRCTHTALMLSLEPVTCKEALFQKKL